MWISNGSVYRGTVYSPFRDRIGEFFSDRPIRIIDGNGSTRVPEILARDWTHTQAAAEGTDVIDANERGITIVGYGSLSPFVDYASPRLQGLNVDGAAEHRVYDVLQPTTYNHGQLEDTEGIVYGEFAERVLVFLAPLNGFMHADLNMEQFLPHATLALLTSDALVAELAAARDIRVREGFGAAIRGRSERELTTVRDSIDEYENNLASYLQRISAARHNLSEQQELLDTIIARREAGVRTDDEIDTEWDALNRHALIRSLDWNDDTLHVMTEGIELTHPHTGETCIVGEFRLELNFQTNHINAHNLTNRRGRHDHPHVREGTFCQGEVGPTLGRLMSERQPAAAVNLAIDSLQHVEPNDDWGRHVAYWLGDDVPPEDEH